jgi:hypothetical protein
LVEFNPEQQFGLNKEEMRLAVGGIQRLMGLAGEDQATLDSYRLLLLREPDTPLQVAFKIIMESYSDPTAGESVEHTFWLPDRLAPVVMEAIQEQVDHLDENPLVSRRPALATYYSAVAGVALQQLSQVRQRAV